MKSPKELLQAWLQAMRIQNLSQNTIEAYGRDVLFFLNFCESKSLELGDIEASDLREYIGERVINESIQTSSLNRQITAIRQFMRWNQQNGHIDTVTLEEVKLNRINKPLPGMVDVETINQILDQPSPKNPDHAQLWLRDKAMLELFYSSGLRLSELQGLVYRDLDFNRMQVRVTGKGDKTRIVPVGSKARDALYEWFKVYRLWSNLEADSPVFITQRGDAINVRQIERRVKFQAQRAGVLVDLHPHLLRHCFASHMLSNAGDIRSIQEMLGHVSLSTTQVYTHIDFDGLASSYDKAHPRASKK